VTIVEKRTVEHVMTQDLVTARGDTPFKELVKEMARQDVSGVPIVDAEHHLIGIVTEADLLRAGEHVEPPPGLLLEMFIDPKRLEQIEQHGAGLRARDVMTHDLVTVTPGTSIHEAAQTMLRREVKRLPVLDEHGTLVGIVSRRDLLRPFLRDDEEIRSEVLEEIFVRTMWIDPRGFGVAVEGGVVTLEGKVDLKSSTEILVEFVRRVPGVVGVENRLTYSRDDRKLGTGPLAQADPGLVRGQR
jgi:CBS domain-containing protein